MATPQIFFTTIELAERWRISRRTLEGWRDRGVGLAYCKIGNRVRYKLADIETYERHWSLTD